MTDQPGPEVIDAGPGCRVPVREIDWRFTTSGGPGGQHANRSQTAVEARIDLRTAEGISRPVRAALMERFGPMLRVSVDATRSQHRNRQLALEEAERLLRRGQRRPKARKATKPSRGAQRRRLEAKKQRSQTKRNRRPPRRDD